MSWLIGIGFWLSIALGMLFLIKFGMYFMLVGRLLFGVSVSILFRHSLFIDLVLPLLAIPYLHDNPGLLWKWMNGYNELPGHGTVGEDPIYNWKSPYLNLGFFSIRAFAIFGVFIAMAAALRYFSSILTRPAPYKTRTMPDVCPQSVFFCVLWR